MYSGPRRKARPVACLGPGWKGSDRRSRRSRSFKRCTRGVPTGADVVTRWVVLPRGMDVRRLLRRYADG